MNLLKFLPGEKITELVKEQIMKIFAYKSKEYNCNLQDVCFIMAIDNKGELHISPFKDKKYLPELSDAEIELILKS